MVEEKTNTTDLISDLPTHILMTISSFLPLPDAFRTSLLSRRWNSLWYPLPLHHPSSHPLFSLSLFLRSYHFPDLCHLPFGGGSGRILAAKGVRKELRLEFSLGLDESEMDPPVYYGLKTMERDVPSPVPDLAPFGTLETLHLRRFSHPGEGFVSSLLGNCQNLRNLVLDGCHGLRSLEIDKQTHSLESLVVRGCLDLEHVAVSAPRLRSFSYRGKLPRIQLANTSCLTEAVLDLEGSQPGGAANFDCEEILSFLASIKDVEFLTISGWLLEWLCSAGVIYKNLEFQFGRLKELRWIDHAIDRTKHDSLACFLNICPLLRNLVVEVDKGHTHVALPLFHQHWHEPHLWRDREAVKADVHEQKHLKSVKISGFTAQNEDELFLIELLHEKAIFLESMTVTSTERKSWRVVKACEDQRPWWTRWKSWRQGEAPSQSKSRFEFVEETQDA